MISIFLLFTSAWLYLLNPHGQEDSAASVAKGEGISA